MKIRHNIFETNSSSTHSFVIYKSNTDYIAPEITDDIVIIQCSEYGWGPHKLTTWIERAEYMATYAATCDEPNAVKKFEKEMSDYLKVRVKIAMPRKNRYDYYDACIDHQSIERAAEMFKDLKNTVFAKKAYILIDNDNSYHYEDEYPDHREYDSEDYKKFRKGIVIKNG